MKTALVLMVALGVLAGCVPEKPAVDRAAETAAVEKAIRSSIEWAIDKDTAELYGTVARDSSFFIFHPDSASTIVGFDAFKNLVESFFMLPEFKATGSEIKNLRIDLSRGGDVAWWSALLDDFGEFKGRPTAWVNTRWTGVLEKREGRWVIVQMHFSFASDD